MFLNRIDGWLLGDFVYGLKKYMMILKLNFLILVEENYNEVYSKIRVVVERVLGVCKFCFRWLFFKKREKYMIRLCLNNCVFNNINKNKYIINIYMYVYFFLMCI